MNKQIEEMIRSVCIHKDIPLESIAAIVPAKKMYLPWLEDDLEGVTCIMTKDGEHVFFEQKYIQPIQAAKPLRMTTVGKLIKKILPEECNLRLSRDDKQYFVCIPGKIWEMEVSSDDQS
jgi:hypothetical protein